MIGIHHGPTSLGCAMSGASIEQWEDFFHGLNSKSTRARLIEHLCRTMSYTETSLDMLDMETLKPMFDYLKEREQREKTQ